MQFHQSRRVFVRVCTRAHRAAVYVGVPAASAGQSAGTLTQAKTEGARPSKEPGVIGVIGVVGVIGADRIWAACTDPGGPARIRPGAIRDLCGSATSVVQRDRCGLARPVAARPSTGHGSQNIIVTRMIGRIRSAAVCLLATNLVASTSVIASSCRRALATVWQAHPAGCIRVPLVFRL